MNKLLKYIGIGVLAVGSVGCSDFLDEYSQDLVVAKNVQHLDELLIGSVYLRSHKVEYGMSPGTYGFVNLLDDDINTTGTAEKGKVGSQAWGRVLLPMFGYFAWQQDVRYNYGGTSYIEDDGTWNTLYRHIAHANNIIDIIDEMPRSTDDEKKQYHRVKGEAYFLRGQFYFALANLYGKAYDPETASADLCVPLKLTPHVEYDKSKPTQFSRASVQEVYNQVVADLLVAQEHLTISPQNARFRLHRASAEAASLLLSRVYLYMQDWEKAEIEARKVMSSPHFALTTIASFKPEEPFLKRGLTEIIFSQGANYVATSNLNFSLTGAASDFCVTRNLYDLYDEYDVRKSTFFAINGSTDSVRLTNKYQRGLELNHISDGWALRMAEAYLNAAEACAMQGGRENDANVVLSQLRRERIHYYQDKTYSGEQLLQEIRNERRRELCFEGHRWFDLRRYAVNKQYPFSKEIVHTYNVFSDDNEFVTTLYYSLPAGDPAYVFAIPKRALEFDKVPMPNNARDKRDAIVILPTAPKAEDNPTEN